MSRSTARTGLLCGRCRKASERRLCLPYRHRLHQTPCRLDEHPSGHDNHIRSAIFFSSPKEARCMTFHPGTRLLAVLLLPTFLPAAGTPDNDPTPLLARIKAVKTEGKGNAEASAAWQQLVQIGPAALLPTLSAMPEN